MSKTSVETKKSLADVSPRKDKKKCKSKKKFVPPSTVRVPSILEGRNSGRWTKEESLLFLYAIKVIGTGRGVWKRIGLFIPTRSRVQVRTHAQKVFRRKEQGVDIFAPLRKNRQLANYLVAQLTATAEEILANAEAARKKETIRAS